MTHFDVNVGWIRRAFCVVIHQFGGLRQKTPNRALPSLDLCNKALTSHFRYKDDPVIGFTLLEVLVSLLLLAMMLLGLDAMQLTTLKEARTAYYFAVATQQLTNFTEQLLLAPQGDVPSLLLEWNQQNQHVLPRGRGSLRGHFPDYQLAIFWGATLSGECNTPLLGKNGCLTEKIHLEA